MCPRISRVANSCRKRRGDKRAASWRCRLGCNDGDVARLLALLDCDGEEARVVGGAVRNALAPASGRRNRRGDDRCAGGSHTPRRARPAARRFRPASSTAPSPPCSISGRSRSPRCARTWKRSAARRASSSAATGSADAERRDFTINALSATADGTVHDYVGGLADIAAHTCVSSASRGGGSKKTICAFCAFSGFTRISARARRTPPACTPASPRALASRRFRASACASEMLKLVVAARATPTLAVMTECGLLGMVLGGVAYLASFENMIKVEDGARRRSPTRSAASARSVCGSPKDAERLTQRLRLSNAEAERLLALDTLVACRGATGDARPPVRFFIGLGRNRSPIACCSPGRGRRPVRRMPALARARELAATLDCAGVSAQSRGLHAARHRRGAFARCGSACRRGGLDRCRFPSDEGALELIADRAARSGQSSFDSPLSPGGNR